MKAGHKLTVTRGRRDSSFPCPMCGVRADVKCPQAPVCDRYDPSWSMGPEPPEYPGDDKRRSTSHKIAARRSGRFAFHD